MKRLFVFVVAYLASWPLVDCKSKPVIAGLSSKWPDTPIIHEASEFLAEESEDLFWKFVDTIVMFQIYQSESSPRMHHEAILKAATLSGINDRLKRNLLKFTLALRTYLPTVEMFHQLAQHNSPSQCELFYDVHGDVTCAKEDLDGLIEKAKAEKKASSSFHRDHIYPVSRSLNETVILYGDMTSLDFKLAHEYLKKKAEDGVFQYVLRHFVKNRPERKARLSGYGIELAIKSTEYKAVDDSQVKSDSDAGTTADDDDVELEGFDFAMLRRRHPDMSSQLTEFRNHLIDSTNEMQPMKVWQLQDLSFQAAARVLSSPPEDQLKVLRDISQNFPIRVRSLVKQQVPDEVRKEIQKNQQFFSEVDLDSGDSLFMLNGMTIDLDDMDMFELLDLLKAEGSLISGLKKLELKGKVLQKVMKLNIKANSNDKHLLDIRDSSIVWVNDIEHDEKYARWPANVHELLRPAFPGTLRRIRKNMFHLVFLVDPTHEDAKYLIESAEIFWANDVPLRIGFSFLVDDKKEADGNEDAGVALVRAYNFVRDELDDNSKAFSFLTGIYKSLNDDETISVDHIKARIQKKFKHADLDEILSPDSEFDENRAFGKAYHTRSGLEGPINVLINGALLTDDDISPDNFEQTVIEKILESTPSLQRAAYMGQLTNDMKALDYLMSLPEVVPRFNNRILFAANNFINFLGNDHGEAVYRNVGDFSKLSSTDKSATLSTELSGLYLSKSDSLKHVRPVTMWIVADVETASGREFVHNALRHLKISSSCRIAIIHNPGSEFKLESATFVKAFEAALATLKNNNARNFISKLMKEENAQQIISGEKSLSDFYVGGMNVGEFEKMMKSDDFPYIYSHADWCASVLGLRPGKSAVVASGKVIGPLNSDEKFLVDDFNLIESTSYSSSSEVQDAVTGLGFDAPKLSDLIMKLTSHLLSQNKIEAERRDISRYSDRHSVVKLPSSAGEDSSYDITLVVDPASEKAQEIVPVVMILKEVLDANVKIFMNCREKLSDMPIKRFYRFVLEPELTFKVDNSFSDGPLAKFFDMPSKSILTLTMHPPEGWMVEVVEAVHDLDNIRLEKIQSKAVTAEYELEYLVLEGHCRDLTTGSPPRGLQFTLGATPDTVAVDTIVMANLGYFQLKANPGVWYLNLREGKSRDIYQITSHDSTDSLNDDVIILMDSFKSKVILIKVSKRPEKIGSSLIEEDDTEPEEEKGGGGIWDSVKSTITGGGSKTQAVENAESSTDVINIFSLASGHLYERLMRIMMLSVITQTKTRVKFWILKNYISPQFKDFIPHLAKEYGFEYELVQYKWPRWLHQQTEKQRTMWGYKILFLDVLFPLSIDKIIFVDADQIVRADLKELRDLDLEGNPYGYTPFCDDRKEMDGFRFWKGGYWASHLAGRKYHISAIYVVDLKKFRKIAAGDRLRGQYQGLSQDPNSLANLDQDLPNNMIHQVGIKSLPQEWLWCATWCSEESKSRAKTIDLCNNPLTKEPKLDAAVRIVPEWTNYDEKIKALHERVENANKTDKSKEKTVASHEKDSSQRKTHDEF
ncbi:unnamed protein product [Clavelina lepadiformis]|uniref:UDP-glucose:glycoprotein glucosyltransferase n=1 Tax=Clavelina lepadiformis TaxID=159417 RepID=A0ABP0G4V5_CLALP